MRISWKSAVEGLLWLVFFPIPFVWEEIRGWKRPHKFSFYDLVLAFVVFLFFADVFGVVMVANWSHRTATLKELGVAAIAPHFAIIIITIAAALIIAWCESDGADKKY